MKRPHLGFLITCVFILAFSVSLRAEGLANPINQNPDDAKVLIDEVRQLRADLQRYTTATYRLQTSLAKLQVQLGKVAVVRDTLAAMRVELENLKSQNDVDKEELRNLTEQASEEMINKEELGIQSANLKRAIASREKLIADMTANELLKEQELSEEQRTIEDISSDINLLETEFKRR